MQVNYDNARACAKKLKSQLASDLDLSVLKSGTLHETVVEAWQAPTADIFLENIQSWKKETSSILSACGALAELIEDITNRMEQDEIEGMKAAAQALAAAQPLSAALDSARPSSIGDIASKAISGLESRGTKSGGAASGGVSKTVNAVKSSVSNTAELAKAASAAKSATDTVKKTTTTSKKTTSGGASSVVGNVTQKAKEAVNATKEAKKKTEQTAEQKAEKAVSDAMNVFNGLFKK